MSGSFEERVHVVPAGRVRTIYDAIPAKMTTIAITATTIRTVRGFLFPPRGSIPGGAPLGCSVAATRFLRFLGNVREHITLCEGNVLRRSAGGRVVQSLDQKRSDH